MKTLCLILLASTLPQDFSLESRPAKPKHFVTYISDQQTIPAGKRATLELHFRVEDGFHVNSHAPISELQIPTVLDLAPDPATKVAALNYPAGKPFIPAYDPTDRLDVYAESFTIRVPVTAAAGPHQLHGTLKYQACDKAACYPARLLPVEVLFIAK